MAYYTRKSWTTRANNSVAFKVAQTSTTWHYPGFGNNSVKTAGWTLQQCFNQYNTWEEQHQARGSKNIEYNFGVTPTGDVVELRGFRQSGANGTSAANRASISVQILIGDTEPLNAKFMKGIAEVIALIKKNQPNAVNKFYPHKHWVGTQCPGEAIEKALNNGTINKSMGGSVSAPSTGGSASKPVSKNVWETSATIKNYSSAQVKDIQNKLVKAGFSVGKSGVDGSYKNDTVNAVKAFQKKNGLSVDGVAGPATMAKLNAADGSKPATKPTVSANKAPAFPLPKGFVYGKSTGPVDHVSGRTSNSKTKDVVKDANGKYYSKGLKQWQAQMLKRGWNGIGKADGRYGPATEKVALQFKQNKKLGNDARIGPVTWAEE